MRYFASRELCRIVGMSPGSLTVLRSAAKCAAPPRTFKARGPGRPRSAFTALHATALLAWRALRLRGVSGPFAAAALKYLWELAPERFEAEVSRGAHYLLAIGSTVLPRLITLEAVQHPEGVSPEVAASLYPFALDVSELYAQVERAADGIDSEAAAPDAVPAVE